MKDLLVFNKLYCSWEGSDGVSSLSINKECFEFEEDFDEDDTKGHEYAKILKLAKKHGKEIFANRIDTKGASSEVIIFKISEKHLSKFSKYLSKEKS